MTSELAHIDNLNLDEGDELHFDDGSVWQITTLDREEDMIKVRRVDEHRRDANDRDAWPAESVEQALIHGDAETGDGRGTEAVKHY